MEWHDCPRCSFRHPWRPGERGCPNEGLTREQVLRIGEAMEVRGGRLVPREQIVKAQAAGRPWEAEGISRATWFRRQRDAKRDGA